MTNNIASESELLAGASDQARSAALSEAQTYIAPPIFITSATPAIGGGSRVNVFAIAQVVEVVYGY